MIGKRLLAGILGAGMLVASAQAHHSFTATYDESKEVRIEGQLVAFHFRNPHASVDLLVPNDSGDTTRWTVEWGGAGQLSSQGVTRDSLKAGDHVVITGNPTRDPNLNRLRMQSLLRPSDGYGWGFEGESFD